MREAGHRKAIYCTNCRERINHIEVRNAEEKARFLADFAAGKYAEEAEQSAEYAGEHET